MRLASLAFALIGLAVAPAALAESAYTPLDLDACEVLETFENGGFDMRCPGYAGIDVFVSEGDARMDADYGVPSDSFETFEAFNSVGRTVEWMLDDDGVVYATALRFLIDVDGRSAQALVVSKPGDDDRPGCVVGVVDAAADQANGVARGLGAMAPLFACETDQVIIVPGAGALAGGFMGANR